MIDKEALLDRRYKYKKDLEKVSEYKYLCMVNDIGENNQYLSDGANYILLIKEDILRQIELIDKELGI